MIDNYRIEKSIHRSGHSEVFLAEEKRSGKLVAIKKVFRRRASDKKWFEKETEISGLFSDSPFAVKMIDAFESEDAFFLVTEYVEGDPISSYSKDWKRILDFFIQLSEALQETHAKGILHGDIKPENILIDSEYRIKLLDFGGSLEKNGGDRIHSGTLPYMSPEQLGYIDYPVGNYTDLYSLGVCFFRLFTGRLPFEHQDRNRLVSRILTETPPKAHDLLSEIPAAIGEVLYTLMRKDPGERYQTAGGLLHDLRRILAKPQEVFSLREKDSTGELNLSAPPVGFESCYELISNSLQQQQSVFFSGQALSGKTTLLHSIPRKFPQNSWIMVNLVSSDKESWGGAVKKIIYKSALLLERREIASLLQSARGQHINSFLPPDFRVSETAQETLEDEAVKEYLQNFLLKFLQFLRSRNMHPLIDDFSFADTLSISLLNAAEIPLVASLPTDTNTLKHFSENAFVDYELQALNQDDRNSLLQNIFSGNISQTDINRILDSWKDYSIFPGELIRNISIMQANKTLTFKRPEGWQLEKDAHISADIHSAFQEYVQENCRKLSRKNRKLLTVSAFFPRGFFANDIEGMPKQIEALTRAKLVEQQKDSRCTLPGEVRQFLLKDISKRSRAFWLKQALEHMRRKPEKYQREITDILIELQSPEAPAQLDLLMQQWWKEYNYGLLAKYFLIAGSFVKSDHDFVNVMNDFLTIRLSFRDIHSLQPLIDRAERIMEDTNHFSEKERSILLTACAMYYYIVADFKKALTYTDTLLPIMKKLGDTKVVYFAHTLRAVILYFAGNFAAVEESCEAAIQSKTGEGIWEREAYTYCLLALPQACRGNIEGAKKNAAYGISLMDSSPNLAEKSACLHFAGFAHSFNEDWKQGLQYSQGALDIGEKLHNALLLYSAHFSMGLGLLMKDDLDHSELHLQKTLELGKKTNQLLGMDWVYNTLGDLCFRRRDRRQFESYLQKLKELQPYLAHSPAYQMNMAKNKGILSLMYQDYPSAKRNFLIALEKSRQKQSPITIEEARICALLFLLHEELGDLEAGLQYKERALEIFDLYGLENDKKYYLQQNWQIHTSESSSTSRGSSSLKETLTYVNILKATAVITSLTDPQLILQKLTDILFQTFGAERIQINLHIEEQEYHLCRNADGQQSFDAFAIEELIQEAKQEGECLVFNDLMEDRPKLAENSKAPERSILIYPIQQENETAGYIYLSNSSLPGTFSREDIRTISAIINQGMITMENAIHFENEKKARANAEATLKAFKLFVPSQFLTVIAREGIDQIRLGNALHTKASILFSDIRNFTALSERMSPEHLMQFLNSYMEEVVGKQISAKGGFIDKFIGDAVMAIFNQESADHALSSAVAIQRALEQFNQNMKKNGEPVLKTGIGINTGEVIMGTVGTTERMDSTLIGDEVNLASRLESLTKQYGIDIIISEGTVKNLERPEDFFLQEIDSVTVKGKSEAVTIYGVFDHEPIETQKLRRSCEKNFISGISLYKAREFEKAAELFLTCKNILPDEKSFQLYIERCRQYSNNPPDESWDGSEKLESK